MRTTYKGVTKEISDNLFEPTKITVNKPRIDYKFDVPSLYFNGKYYFMQDLKPIHPKLLEERKEYAERGYKYEIQVVYYDGKWRQDTHYITEEKKELLNNVWKDYETTI